MNTRTLLALGALLACSTNAEAGERGKVKRLIWAPEPVRSFGFLDTVIWPTKKAIDFTGVLGGHGAVAPHVMLDVYVPLTIVAPVGQSSTPSSPTRHGSSDSSSLAGIGNPTVMARYASDPGMFTWTLGGGMSVPLASVDSWKLRLADGAGMAAMGATMRTSGRARPCPSSPTSRRSCGRSASSPCG
jgi:hypothetical protein